MTRTGGCQCGAVRYECAGEPFALFICHCTECRKQSASAFGMSLPAPREGFRITKGEPKFWSRRGDSGLQINGAFCPHCGSRLWDEPQDAPDIVVLKGGSLDQPIDMAKAIHIWTSRKLPGMIIPPDAAQFPEEPG
ncbi:GFA family protein [Taklimakanibacter lacteus]|uniref:GFA family protein n=1 Tax=Taklimakanibacter lacteus TaxID=2268456 RepID=UPI000E66FEC8